MAVVTPRILGDSCITSLSPSEARAARTSTRAAAIVFAVACVLGAVVLLTVLGRGMWFAMDEWQFLVHRHVGDVFADHNGHWSTTPLLLYRALYNLVGVRSYLPYQALVVSAHIGLVIVLRGLLRQAGVSPWVATAVPLSLLLFGTGAHNIVWAFQVGFVGAIALALTQFLLANHDGPIGRRDLGAVLCGLAALTFAGTAVPVIAMTAGAVLLRRGWRAALLQAGPPAVVYLVWRALAHDATSLRSSETMVRGAMDFARSGVSAAFRGLGGDSTAVASLLVLVLIVGAFMAIFQRRHDRKELLRLAPIGVLALGVIAALAMIGTERWGMFGPEGAASSRYVYMSAALLLVPLGVAADAFVRRWPLAIVPLCAILFAGVPHNIAAFDSVSKLLVQNPGNRAGLVVALANHRLVDLVPANAAPHIPALPRITVGWLRDARDSGRLPDIEGPRVPIIAPRLRFGLSVLSPRLVDESLLRDPADCPVLADPTRVALQRGDILQFDARGHRRNSQLLAIQEVRDGKPHDQWLPYTPLTGTVLRVELPQLRMVEIRPVGSAPVRLCLPRGSG